MSEIFKTNKKFTLASKYKPAGDQAKAINTIVNGIKANKKNQVLLGVTGSGKTFTVANVIEKTQRPTVIMVHNKTLAAQLYSELKDFFPNNAVEYYISYFDYYQPEAYKASSNTYIDKDSLINSKLEQLTSAAVFSLLERKDVIVVCSVSAIFGIGDRTYYESSRLILEQGLTITIPQLSLMLVKLQYVRNDIEFSRTKFRIKGDIVEIYPAYLDDKAVRLSFFGDEIESISLIDPLTGIKIEELSNIKLYSATLYAIPTSIINDAVKAIRVELQETIEKFRQENKFIEAQRLEERTNYDIEMLVATGYCKGIENYSRYFSNKSEDAPPATLFDYLPENTLIVVDESHVTLPQLRAMYNANLNRKTTLINYGFRLPSCLSNRPLRFEEWDDYRKNTIFVSATPGPYELDASHGEVIEQVIRPTGLLDPICEVKPLENQVQDVMNEAAKLIPKKQKILAITLTKKMAEHLTDYLNDSGIRAKYIHSDIDTIERISIIQGLRQDKFDILVGINLLREGLDIPEVSLVAILDADKEGFLRSKTSLIQTIGRAARNSEGRVILYADKMTESLEYAISETNRRRAIQQQYNTENNIIPKTVTSKIMQVELQPFETVKNGKVKNALKEQNQISREYLEKQKNELNKQMIKFAEDLDFEKAISLREQIKQIDDLLLQL